MTHLLNNIQITVNSKQLTDNEKVQAVKNEMLEDEIIYNNPRSRGRALDPEDFLNKDEGIGFELSTLEDRCDTNIDTLYLEEGLDVDLLYRVREHHNMEEIPQEVFDKREDMKDCQTYNPKSADEKGKRFVMSERKEGNGIRRIIRNAEGNFEEWENEDDKPDWLLESERNAEKVRKYKKEKRCMKMLWKLIKENRQKYKRLYDVMDKIKGTKRGMELKKEGDKYYKQYLKRSKYMDRINELNDKIETKKRVKEAEDILYYFVEFQREAPSNIIEKLPREDVKARYKKYGYISTIDYLKRCIEKAKSLS